MTSINSRWKPSHEDWRLRQKETAPSRGTSPAETRSPGALFLPALAFSMFMIQLPNLPTGLFLVDIALTFATIVGVAGQIMTVASLINIMVSLAMGALSIRFRHKALLLAGIASMGVAALGCSIAPSLETMMISYSLVGFGMSAIGSMSRTLVGEQLPTEKRTAALGWLNTGMSLSFIVGPPIIVFIAGLGGWRSAFFAYVLPVSLLAFLAVVKGVASSPHAVRPSGVGGNYFGAFAGVLSDRSAAACLLGTVCMMTSWGGVLAYASSFLRQRFLVSTGVVSAFLMTVSIVAIVGYQVAGRLVKRVGRKTLSVASTLAMGLFVVSFSNTSSFPLVLVLAHLGTLCMGVALTASLSLMIEQVPRFRSTLMSLNAAAMAVGNTLGSALGGLALLQFNYEGMWIVVGIFGVVAGLIFQFLAIDPTRVGTRA